MCSMSFFLNVSFANEGSAKQIGKFLSNMPMIIAGRNRPCSAFVHLFEVGGHRSSSRDSSSVLRLMKTMIMRRTILWPLIASLAVLAMGLLWTFWPILVAMAERWSNDPRYAHGYLVPMFSLALLWMRRSRIPGDELRSSSRGLAFIALGAVILLIGGYFRQGTIEGLALLGARHPLQSRVVFAIKSSRFPLSPETQLQEGARDGARQSPRDRQG
jgi:hypothetical protein